MATPLVTIPSQFNVTLDGTPADPIPVKITLGDKTLVAIAVIAVALVLRR